MTSLSTFDSAIEKIRNDGRSIVFDAGFELYHTGGGCIAFMKPTDGATGEWLITDSSGTNVDADADEPKWFVGRYEFDDEGETSFVVVKEETTLAEVLARYEMLPVPATDDKGRPTETSYETWDEFSSAAPAIG